MESFTQFGRARVFLFPRIDGIQAQSLAPKGPILRDCTDSQPLKYP